MIQKSVERILFIHFCVGQRCLLLQSIPISVPQIQHVSVCQIVHLSAPTVKGIAGAQPASGRSEAGPALWSFISTNYLFKAIGKPWLGRLMR